MEEVEQDALDLAFARFRAASQSLQDTAEMVQKGVVLLPIDRVAEVVSALRHCRNATCENSCVRLAAELQILIGMEQNGG